MKEAEHSRRTPSPQRGEGWGEGAPAAGDGAPVRHDWTRAEVRALFDLPFPELMFRAQSVHRTHFEPGAVQISTLLSIKTGGCPEDCAYCPQSAHHQAGVKAEKLMDVAAEKSKYEKLLEQFDQAMAAYRSQNWREAAALFADVLLKFPDDGPSQVFLERAIEFSQSAPESEWDGVYVMKTK